MKKTTSKIYKSIVEVLNYKEIKMNNKTYPKVGDKLFLKQFTGSYYIDIVKRPYTVIEVTPTMVTIQACKLIYPIFVYDATKMTEYYKEFDGRRVSFYDTIAESIEPDTNGRIEQLYWHPKRSMWGTKGPDSSYPQYAVFGEYKHQPYLD
jgi:hypothetical protein